MTIGIPLIANINRLIVNPIILFLIFLGVLVFLWGVTQTIMSADDTEKRKEGYQHMIWGLVGIAIMVGVFGLVNLIQTTVNGLG